MPSACAGRAFLASAAVGAGIGAGAGALVSAADKEVIRTEETLPLNSSGIVAMFEERWEDDIDKALSNASNVTTEKVDRDSANQVKAAATKS